MSSRPWLPHAAALRLKAKNLQANAVTLRIRLVASYGRVIRSRRLCCRTVACWAAPFRRAF